MKLHHSPRSPYVRKVRVAAHELGLHDRLELIEATVQNVIEQVSPDNPLGQIPTLVLDDGTALYDSPVIVDFLDTLHDAPPLIPRAGPERWRALGQQALGDAMMDQAIAIYSDPARKLGEPLSSMTRRRTDRLERCLDTLETNLDELGGATTIGLISVGCALGYLDFRLKPDFWRPGRAALAAWADRFAERPSMRSTPHLPAE